MRLSYLPSDPADAHDVSVAPSSWALEIATMIVIGSLGAILLGLTIYTAIHLRQRRREAAPA